MSRELSVGDPARHAELVLQWRQAFALDSRPEDTIGRERELETLTGTLRGMMAPRDADVPFRRVRSVARGAILHGPPGTGKSHLARAASRNLGVPILMVQMAQLVGAGVYGESARRVTALFEAGIALAKETSGCILYLEEADALGSRYSGSSESSWFAMFIGNLLGGIDRAASQGSGGRLGIIAATNRLDAMDPALLDRLSCKIEVKAPNPTERMTYLKHVVGEGQATGIVQGPIDLTHLVDVTDGWNLREISHALDEVNSEWLARSLESHHVTDAELRNVFHRRALRRDKLDAQRLETASPDGYA